MTAFSDVGELLRHHRLRVTPQRRAILEAFRGMPDEHLSAEEVLSRASVAVPEIGRGTVYASLAELTELGLLSSVGQAEPTRYETNVDPHDHFHCRLCMRLFDIDLRSSELLPLAPEGYSVESVTVRAEGICARCSDYHRGLAAGVRSVKDHPTLDADALGHLGCVVIDTPLGELALGASGDGIVHVAFADHADFDPMTKRAALPGPRAARSHLRVLDDALQRYLAGSDALPSQTIDWSMIGTSTAVLRHVCEIPYGESDSYENVCSDTIPYHCGLAVGHNPIPLLVPCHRVRCGPSRPDIYVGGSERLRFLHRLEGAQI
jgi:Fe2+ or Zn2+ uptake regulation protein/O6-methylguanine-DNA--protein-cysteine methyltransferase